MDFRNSVMLIGTSLFAQTFARELQGYVACLNVRNLTRCGGSARQPELLSFSDLTFHDQSLVVKVCIKFNDGTGLDCSGYCGGEVVERTETLIVTIDKTTNNAHWITADGVISSIE